MPSEAPREVAPPKGDGLRCSRRKPGASRDPAVNTGPVSSTGWHFRRYDEANVIPAHAGIHCDEHRDIGALDTGFRRNDKS